MRRAFPGRGRKCGGARRISRILQMLGSPQGEKLFFDQHFRTTQRSIFLLLIGRTYVTGGATYLEEVSSGVFPMIVCSCNVLTDQDVRAVVSNPEAPRTAGQVYGCLGCSPQCGRCARTIKRIMDEALSGAACCNGC